MGCDWAPFRSRRVAFTPAEQGNSQTVGAHRNTAARKSIETGVFNLGRRAPRENVPHAPSEGEQSGEQRRGQNGWRQQLLLSRSNAPSSTPRKCWVRALPLSQTAGILQESCGFPPISIISVRWWCKQTKVKHPGRITSSQILGSCASTLSHQLLPGKNQSASKPLSCTVNYLYHENGGNAPTPGAEGGQASY